MSSTYNLEPPPTAKVLLQTSSGEIELEIFAKQTPLTSRNFLQHCLDGYYDGTIFHRLLPGFVLQGGDPTGSGDGGESSFEDGKPFADEFHSRLKFNRRGLLGMANTGKRDDNGSQFFLTLGKTEELTGKNTMFGRVVGDTIYNVVKMGETELIESSERPLYPTKITTAEILLNPFKDMVKRHIKPSTVTQAPTVPEKKKGKRKGAKVLLSFGVEEGEEEGEPAPKRAKFNTRLVAADPDANVSATKSTIASAEKTYGQATRKWPSRSSSPDVHVPKAPAEPQLQLPLPDEERAERDRTSSPSSISEPEQVKRVSSMLDRTNAQIAELKASMKRNIAPVAEEQPKKLSALEEMIPATAIRGRKRKQGNLGGIGGEMSASDAQALKMLNAFRAKLDNAPEERKSERTKEHGQVGNEGNDAGDNQDDRPKTAADNDDKEAALCDLHFIANCQSCRSWADDAAELARQEESGEVAGKGDELKDRSWMSHALHFGKDTLGKDLEWKKNRTGRLGDEDDDDDGMVVIDPREKARDLKEDRNDRKEKGRQNDWDRDRDGGIDRERYGDRERRLVSDRHQDRDRNLNREHDRSSRAAGEHGRRRDHDRYRDRGWDKGRDRSLDGDRYRGGHRRDDRSRDRRHGREDRDRDRHHRRDLVERRR